MTNFINIIAVTLLAHYLLAGTFAESTSVINVSSGSSTTLTCNIGKASQNDAIAWYKIFTNDSKTELKISEDQTIVCCTSEGANKFKASYSGDRSQLTINRITGLDEAFYRCRRNSDSLKDPTTYKLSVQALVTENNMYVTYSNGTNGYYVIGAEVVLTCTVFDVKPPPDVYWVQLSSSDSDTYKILPSEQSKEILNDNFLYNRTATLKISASRELLFNVLRCRSRQNITNGINQIAIASTPTPINVRYGPICSTTKVTKFAAAMNSYAMVSCYIEKNELPDKAPSCYWKSDKTSPTKLATVTSTLDWYNYMITTSYNQTVTKSTDYRNLYCYCPGVNEDLPCSAQVVPPGLPDSPTNCRQASTTSSSLNINCDVGFDGGSQTYFALDQMSKEAYVPTRAASDIVVTRLVSGASKPNFVVNNLSPSSRYQFRVCVTNRAFPDMQQCTQMFTVNTIVGPEGSNLATASVEWWIILVGVGAALLLIVVIMVIVFLIMGCRKKRDDQYYEDPVKPEATCDVESGCAHPTISSPVLTSSPPIELEYYPTAGAAAVVAAVAAEEAIYNNNPAHVEPIPVAPVVIPVPIIVTAEPVEPEVEEIPAIIHAQYPAPVEEEVPIVVEPVQESCPPPVEEEETPIIVVPIPIVQDMTMPACEPEMEIEEIPAVIHARYPLEDDEEPHHHHHSDLQSEIVARAAAIAAAAAVTVAAEAIAEAAVKEHERAEAENDSHRSSISSGGDYKTAQNNN